MVRLQMATHRDSSVVNSQAKQFQQFQTKQTCVPVPSFIRLFMMRRIVSQYIDDNKAKHVDIKVTDIIKDLVHNCFKGDEKACSSAFNIVTRLINDGIKQFMSKWYKEEEEANFIEILFNKIITNNFSAQYHQLI